MPLLFVLDFFSVSVLEDVSQSRSKPVFNQSSTDYQDFEVPIDDETQLVYKILQMAGMSIREGDIFQYANAEEIQNEQ